MRHQNGTRVGWVLVLLVLLGLSGLIACNDEGVEFNNDGDGTELEGYDNVEMVGLQGGSGTEGNPAIVVMGFALDTVEFDKWSGTSLDIRRLLLEHSEGDADPLEYSTAGSIESVALDRPKPTPIRINAPTDEAFTGIVLSSENNERTLRLDVTYNGNTVNVEIPEGIQFGLMEGITPWVAGTHGYLLYLPLNAWVEQLGGSLENVSTTDIEWLTERIAVYQDTNRDAQLDDEEKSEENRADTKSSRNAIPPEPVLLLHSDYEDYVKIADLNGIKLDASQSISHMGAGRLPFEYYYRWSSVGKPWEAVDSVLTCTTCDMVNPTDIMASWTDNSTPKIFIPVAGVYGFEVKVRDNQGLESGPNAACPDCPEWGTLLLDVKPSERIHIELVWDKGGSTDMDLYLIRYRDEGTMGYSFPNAVYPENPPVTACSDTTPCPNNASGTPFACANGSCRWECDSDADCGNVPAAGLICSSNNVCIKRTGDIPCEEDDDCGNYYCNPKAYTSDERICTMYSWDSMNDTCFYSSRNPHWTVAGYEEDSDNYPSLDIDDVTGYGPENISLKEPLPGRYRVIARLYNAGSEENGDPIISETNPGTAYVKIYLNGNLVLASGSDFAMTQQFTRANVYWKVADIVWSGTGDNGVGAMVPIATTNNGGSETENLESNPYANPFYNSIGIGFFDPNSTTYPRSIWCDAATDEYAPGKTCAELYAK